MAALSANNMPVNPDTTMITVKVAIDNTNRRFKVALRDLGANTFPDKLRALLAIPSDAYVTFERYSDSAGNFVTLDSNNPAVYKQLYRAAKAKLKLRIRATVTPPVKPKELEMKSTMDGVPVLDLPSNFRPRSSYLETVLEPSTVPRPANQSSLRTSLPNITTETLISPPKSEETKTHPYSELDNLSKPCLPMFHDFPSTVFCIDCNNCGGSIPGEHYHCSICDAGDFDLCLDCVENSVLCGGEGHWLIKRNLQNGRVISSVTETIAPKKPRSSEPKPVEPVEPVESVNDYVVERTCNACIGEFPNNEFVSCAECFDFDLCINCLICGEHGHDPSHRFYSHDEKTNSTNSSSLVAALCKPGRNITHLAICDGCDKHIVGVRHKCLSCPDWDYCSDCFVSANVKHPGHRFAPLYEQIADPKLAREIHFGIYCDGPLCENKPRSHSYIQGVRYKCAVCHDTDFCANCEAHPSNRHDDSHPVIKLKTPVKHVSVTTFGETPNGMKMAPMGDRINRLSRCQAQGIPRSTRTAATETIPVTKSTNAATQVQTMADLKPVPIQPVGSPAPPADLDARFVCDTVADGTVLPPSTTFEQIWTLTNPGPETWPIGCSVRYIGGDSMLNLDPHHATGVDDIASASESNVLQVPIKAGESADFKVTMKTLAREGRVISYWRLKTAEGMPFGHKLWCDISIRATPEAKTESGYVAPTVQDEQEEKSIKGEEGSTMIFPRLDKESPLSSVHEEVKFETNSAPVSEIASKSVDEDFLEDVESLELDEHSDDGFLTDEEYDILDASDEEFLSEAQKAVKQN